jgi:hypothetical protein
MTRLLALLVALSLPAAASATCTWTNTNAYEAKLVCTTANESAPSAATDGFDFSQCLKGVSLFICADSGQTLSGSGTVKLYQRHPIAALWGEIPDLNVSPTVSSVRCQGFPGIWSVVAQGRLAVQPVSVGVSSGGFTAWLTCN